LVLVLGFPGSSDSSSLNDDVTIQPTETVYNSDPIIDPPKKEVEEIVKKEVTKVKSASLAIDKVQVQLANLYPTRLTVLNTGDISISPKFDVYVFDKNDEEICSGSPLFDEFGSISSNQQETGEISIMGCMFEKDGTYTLKVDLLDSNYQKLDSNSRDFSVNYWGKFS
jgi:hypothetical protein